jgi:hypothetical protein
VRAPVGVDGGQPECLRFVGSHASTDVARGSFSSPVVRTRLRSAELGGVSAHRDVPDTVVARLDRICRTLPEARQEEAWAGVRWCVGSKTFAHAVAIDGGWPPAYARAAGTDGPVTVLTFRAVADEVAAFSSMGHDV